MSTSAQKATARQLIETARQLSFPLRKQIAAVIMRPTPEEVSAIRRRAINMRHRRNRLQRREEKAA